MAKKVNTKKNVSNSDSLRKSSYNNGVNKGVLSKSDFKFLVKKGLGVAESDNRYNLKNKNSSATGKYQFLWGTWGDEIVAYAKKDPKLSHIVNSSEFKKNPQQAFLNSPAWQESFMDSHLEKEYEKTLRLYKDHGRDMGLRMDEVYAQIHHQGLGNATKNLKSGIINYKSKDGTSGNKYYQRYNRGVFDSLGMPKDSKGNYLGNRTQRNEAILRHVSNPKSKGIQDPTSIKFTVNGGVQAYKDYKQEMNDLKKQIESGKINEEVAIEMQSSIMKKYHDKGFSDYINQSISKENASLKASKYSRAQTYNEITDMLNKGKYSTRQVKNQKGEDIRVLNKNGFSIEYKSLTPMQKRIIKENPEMFDNTKDNGNVYIKDFDKVNNFIKQKQSEFFGSKNAIDVFKKGTKGEIIINNALSFNDVKGTRILGSPLLMGTNGNELSTSGYSKLKNSLKKAQYDSGLVDSGLAFINPELFQNLSTEPQIGLENYDLGGGSSYDSAPSPSNSESSDSFNKEWMDYIKERDKKEAENKEREERNNSLSEANDWASNETTFQNPIGLTYNKDDYKTELPVTDLATSIAGTIAGMEMQDQDDPLRDEQVSGAFQSYAAQMAEISKRGLSIADESAALNKLNEAYSAGIAQVVKASGGHRNTVLGNMARLDAQKQMGLVDIAVADSEMKMKGLQAYGEAMKYISEHDNNIEAINNDRQYQLAQQRRMDGKDLVTASWSNLMSSIDNFENTRPGSAYHMSEVYQLDNMYGYNPLLKDDRSGTQKGTLSYNERIAQENIKKAAPGNAFKQKFMTLTDDQKLFINRMRYDNNENYEQLNATADYLIANNDKIDYNALKSSSTNDFYINNVSKNNQLKPVSSLNPEDAFNEMNKINESAIVQTSPTQIEQPKIDDTSSNLAETLSSNLFMNVGNLINNLNNKA